MAKTTDKMLQFVDEYVIDKNASAAARRAGYSKKTAHAMGAENLRKPLIKALIKKKLGELAAKNEVTAERVVAEMAKLAFAEPEAYYRINADGDAVVDLSNLTSDQWAAVQEVSTTRIQSKDKRAKGQDKDTVIATKMKLADKKGNLELLARHLGILTDNIHNTGEIKIHVDGDDKDV